MKGAPLLLRESTILVECAGEMNRLSCSARDRLSAAVFWCAFKCTKKGKQCGEMFARGGGKSAHRGGSGGGIVVRAAYLGPYLESVNEP